MLAPRWVVVALASAAVAACLWVGWRIWMTPVRYEIVDATADGAGANPRFEDRRFAETSRLGVLPLVAPVVLSGLGVWAAARGSRRGLVSSAVALGIFAFIGGFSIGAAYWPAVCLLALAGIACRSSRSRSPRIGGAP